MVDQKEAQHQDTSKVNDETKTQDEAGMSEEELERYLQDYRKSVGQSSAEAEADDEEDADVANDQKSTNYDKRLKKLEDDRRKREEEDVAREVQADLDKAIGTVKTKVEALANVPNAVIQGYMEVEARKDPGLLGAFVNRHKNPQAWDAVALRLGKRLGEELSGDSKKVDEASNRGRDALRRAARTTTDRPAANKLPGGHTPEELGEMSDEQYAKVLAEAEKGAA